MKILNRNYTVLPFLLMLLFGLFFNFSNISYAQTMDTQSLIAQLQQKVEQLKQELQTYLNKSVVSNAISSADVQINDLVQATANVNARVTPEVSGQIIAVMKVSSLGTVLAGPSKMVDGQIVQQTTTGGDTWWQVQYDSGVVGWTSSLWLRDTSASYGGTYDNTTAVTCDSFTLNPPTVNFGGTVTATWNTTNADTVVLKYNGAQAVIKHNLPGDGSYVFSPDQTRSDGVGVFALIAIGKNNTQATCVSSVVIRFETKLIPPENTTISNALQKCEVFAFTPGDVRKGNEVTLNWNVTNSSKVLLKNTSDSTLVEYPTEGSLTFVADKHVTYTLTGVNSQGKQRVLCSTTLVVQDEPIAETNPVCDYFYVSPAVAKPGDAVTYKWHTINAQKVYLTDSYGDYFEVPLDGEWNNTAPSRSGLFTLSVIGNGGTRVGCSSFLTIKYK